MQTWLADYSDVTVYFTVEKIFASNELKKFHVVRVRGTVNPK